MQLPFTTILALQAFNDLLHLLCFVFVRNQKGIRSLNHDQVINADTGHQTASRHNQRIATVLQENIPLHDIAVAVFRQHLPQGIPSAHIGPAGAQRNKHAEGQLQLARRDVLHYRVINGILWATRKSIRINTQKLTIKRSMLPSLTTGRQNIGATYADRREPDRSAHHEQTAIPQVRSGINVALRRCQIGLLDKTPDFAGVSFAQSGPGLDIAVARLGRIRRNAEGNDYSFFS